MNILIAEDHPLYVVGMESMLVDYNVKAKIFEAADFKKALKLLDIHKFDLMIMNISIPFGDTISMVSSVRLKQPGIPILICTGYDESLYALSYLRAGANGYISKTASAIDFKLAVEQVLKGQIYASSAVFSSLFGLVFDYRSDDNFPINKLSEKEAEVARLLAKGLATKEIGEFINLSSSSISNYKAKIFQKLGVANVIQLMNILDVK